MKKMFKYASLSAIAFVGAVSFSACSSSDEVTVENNPNYDPETNKVKTEFVINVTQPGERTRQTSDVVGNGSFQGINDMYLFCFGAAPASASAIDANHMFSLDALGKPNPSLDNTDATITNSSSKVYTLYIPTETTNFLFYATANNGTKNNSPEIYGKLTKTYNATTAPTAVSGITFSLVPRVATLAEVTTPQTTLLGILNGIAGESISSPESKTWASTSGATNVHFVALGKAYDKFVNQASEGDVRQGSSAAILNMVGNLFTAVNDVYTSETDATAKALAKAIIDKIALSFTITQTGTEPSITYTWGGSYKSGTDASVSNYPGQLGLPDGSAVLSCTSGTFSYINNGTMGSSQSISLAYDKITYPSELTYYCNSGLWQSTTAKEASSYPTTSKAWTTEGNWNGWTNTKVTSATRAVAMKENITYGAAQLQSVVTLGVTTFTDNAAGVTNNEIANNSFDGTTTDKTITFTVTGVLIGGQPDAATFEYLPSGTSVTNVIYDPITSSNTLVSNVTTGTVTNYTLVLDNYTSAESQSKVYIALEMTADKSFYGVSGFMPAGEKFYLIGELDPGKEGLTAVDWTKQTSFESGDTGYNKDRVFIRDAKTVANFTLGTNALQKAYSTIPDLRSTQMVFGISVDLAWKAGLTFDVPIN